MANERMVIWQGISELDGVTPLVVLATGVPKSTASKAKASANVKTGDMIQTYILRADVSPLDTMREGKDEAICGSCPHRSKNSGGSGACYVNVGQGPRSTWAAHERTGSVPFDVNRLAGRKVRFGTYGDPAAVPFEVWESIAAVAESVTAYTHQWRTADPRFAELCMASADSAQETADANSKGYRTFEVRPLGTAKPKGSVVCPASEEAGKKLVCASCMMCGGASSKQTRNITIMAHGPSKRMFAAAV